MPGIPRLNQKAEKIAFKIMGVPVNMRKNKRASESKKIDKRDKKLSYRDTRDVK